MQIAGCFLARMNAALGAQFLKYLALQSTALRRDTNFSRGRAATERPQLFLNSFRAGIFRNDLTLIRRDRINMRRSFTLLKVSRELQV
jgi:hypothetical protein